MFINYLFYFLIILFMLLFSSCNYKANNNYFKAHENISISKPILIDYMNANRTIYTTSKIDTFIILELEIDTLGYVKNLKIIKSYNEYYDSLAIAIAKEYKYKPAQIFYPKKKSIKKIESKIKVPIFIKSK